MFSIYSIRSAAFRDMLTEQNENNVLEEKRKEKLKTKMKFSSSK